jgi:hypothetical protein
MASSSAEPDRRVDLYQTSLAVCNRIENELAENGRVPPRLARDLALLERYATSRKKLQASRVPKSLVWVFSVLLTVVMVLSTIRRHPIADVDVLVSSAVLTLDGQATSTASLFGTSTSVEAEAGDLLAQCELAPEAAGAGARISMKAPGPWSPLFVGDGEPLNRDLALRYRIGDDRSVWLSLQPSARSMGALRIPVGVTAGSVSFGSSNRPPCALADDRIELIGRQFRFAPVERVGPLAVKKVDFFDHRSVGERLYAYSNVRSGVVRFDALSGAHLDIQQGASLVLSPSSAPLITYITPEAAGIRLVIHGSFVQISDSGKDLRPSLLEELWGSPYLREIATALSALVTIAVTVLRRFGIEA